MFRSIIRFDLLLIIIFSMFLIEKIFIFNTIITPFLMILFLIFVLFIYIIENKIKVNIFIIFFIYLFVRTFFNLVSTDKYIFQIGFTSSIQIISYACITPAIYYILQNHEDRIRIIINTIKIFILLNTIFLILSAFNIYIFNKNLYESYGDRHFGILGDQLPWIITFLVSYAIHHKKYYMLVFSFIGLFFSGSLNASILGLIIIFYYIIKKISLKNIFFISVFLLICISLLFYFDFFWRLTSGQYENSLNLRILSIGFAISNINNYFFGNGYGTYSYIVENSISDTTVSQVIFSSAFNQYLQIFIDLGIIGLILFFVLCYKIFKLKTYKFSYIKIWVISLLIFNQSAVWLLPSSYICILISIALGILMYDDKKIKMNVLK